MGWWSVVGGLMVQVSVVGGSVEDLSGGCWSVVGESVEDLLVGRWSVGWWRTCRWVGGFVISPFQLSLSVA